MHRAAKGRIWQTVVLVATVLALAVALPAGASIPTLETRPSLEALAAQAVVEPPAPAGADERFRLYADDRLPVAGAAQGRFHLFPEATTRVWAIDLEIVPHVELRGFQVPEHTGFALLGGGKSRQRARILYYAKARYYDPELGLFLTEDPFQGEVNNPPSLHRYLYAYQNPTVWVDPTGEQNELLEPSRPRVIDSPSEAPEGWTVKWIGEGIYLAHPPDSAPQPAPGSQAEEPDVLDRLYDLVFGDAEEEGAKLVEEGAELERTFDRGIFRDVELDVENMTEEELRAALEEARGLPAAGETVRQGGRVAGQAGTTALEAEETASAITLAGLFRGLGRKALRLFGREAREDLLGELSEAGIKHTPVEVLRVSRDRSGRIVFLESGNSRAGLQHIVQRHAEDFSRIGVAEDQIPDLLITATTKGRIVGEQGSRPIYEVVFGGEVRRVAVTVGDNGFIVGANPVGR